MNIIYIHTHDSGRYVGPYGYQGMTPNIDRLGHDSAVFRQCYCAGPTCSPSRAALLTGRWPHCNGMLGLAQRGFALYDYGTHVVPTFNANGFETVLAGIQHEAVNAQKIGYQVILNQPERDDMYIPNPEEYDKASVNELEKYLAGRNPETPFFISLGLISCHRNFPESTVEAGYVAPPPQLYDCPQARKDMAGYLTSVKIADECVGKAVSMLKGHGLYENTVILFTTDHGIAFPWMKCNLYDTGIGVACMLREPGGRMNGMVSDALISHIDIFPTIFELCGIAKPQWMQGKSLMPILRGERDEVNEEIFAEVTYHAAYEPMRCVRTSRYKLVRRFDDYDGIVPSNIDNGHSKQFLLDAGLLKKKHPKDLLFDLFLDPLERENLMENEDYAEIRQMMQDKLENWMAETDDPLLNAGNRAAAPPGTTSQRQTATPPGAISQRPVAAPPGAKVNRQSCLHAEIPDYE